MWSFIFNCLLYYSASGASIAAAPITSQKMNTVVHSNASSNSFNFMNQKIDVYSDSQLFLLVSVCSAVGNMELRQAIRDTWASNLPEDTKLIFFVGRSDDIYLEKKLGEEILQCNDIIQVDFIDSYQNLTLKSVAMLQWIQMYSSQVKYVLKTDDDIFINVPLLIKDLMNTIHSHFIMGQLIAGAQPDRDKLSKWYTPESIYPADRYPEYISGCAYVISGDIIQGLYEATLSTPLYWIEDVYITAMCAHTAGARHVFNAKFGYKNRDSCMAHNVITSHRLTPHTMRTLWEEFNTGVDC